MRIQKKKGRAAGVCTAKLKMYRASLLKLDAAYFDAACRYRKPIEDFAELMVSTYSMSHAYASHSLVIECQARIFGLKVKRAQLFANLQYGKPRISDVLQSRMNA